ncbi:MAG: NAD(P)/FAD-dependent oxidoreductase [Chitinophagales bacterium]
MQKKLGIIGGGAAAFFAALNVAELNPEIEIHIFEKAAQFLSKVKISGGGRCNVTNACFEPAELIKNYPRGAKELLGPFHIFNPADTVEWFENKNVSIQAEEDGRMFPRSNSSQTIIDCFLSASHENNIHLHLQTGVQDIQKANDKWQLTFLNKEIFDCDYLLIASGSSNQIWNCISALEHTIVPPVASLFTFNIQDNRLEGLMGVSIPDVICSIENTKIKTDGPLLITHWGLSGPAVLKLSAWAARELHALNYNFKLKVNFIPGYEFAACYQLLQSLKISSPKKLIHNTSIENIPSRLHKSLCEFVGISPSLNWADISKDKMQLLAQTFTQSIFNVQGKSNFKDEFVTCGGVELNEVDFKTMQSKLHNNLYFAGEVLNIDAITGGFNFQSAWTTAFIAAQHIGRS